MKRIEDREILDCLADDRHFDRGFEMLVLKYQERLYWHIRRMVHFHEDADDIIQNTFIKVFRHIRGFKEDSKLYTWLYRIASNESITHLNKRKKRNSLIGASEDPETFENKLEADPYFDGDDAQKLLVTATAFLPDRQKLVFNLRYYDEMNYKEMAEVLEVSEGALKASYHHAVKKIEKYLKENLDYVP